MTLQPMDFRLDGKVALVTGAGRGIGKGLAWALASAGCAVAIQDIDQDVAAREAERIAAQGGRATALGGDIGDRTLPSRLIRQTVENLGGLHVLINNAAIQEEQHWLEVSVESMERQFRADLIAPILLSQAAVPIFKRQRFGRIINVGSIQQRSANPNMLAYSLSKAALEKLTIGLARELAPDGITVNLIAPGYFNTHRNREQFQTSEEIQRRGARAVPMGRVGDPDDCAGAVLMLCGKAGEYITGQSIHIDGGMSAR